MAPSAVAGRGELVFAGQCATRLYCAENVAARSANTVQSLWSRLERIHRECC